MNESHAVASLRRAAASRHVATRRDIIPGQQRHRYNHTRTTQNNARLSVAYLVGRIGTMPPPTRTMAGHAATPIWRQRNNAQWNRRDQRPTDEHTTPRTPKSNGHRISSLERTIRSQMPRCLPPPPPCRRVAAARQRQRQRPAPAATHSHAVAYY